MKSPACPPAIADGAVVVSVDSMPVSSAPPQLFSTESSPAADGNDLPTQLRQIKTKVTERVKKTPGKPDTIIWDVRVGLALFNVYRTPHGNREFYTLSYSLDGKRYRQLFPTLALAIDAAKTKGRDLAKGDIVAVDMSPADRASAAKVLAKVKARGLSLELVVSECLDARDRLGPVSISQAVDSHLKRFPRDMPSKLVKEVVNEMLEMKRDKLSERYVKQLEYDMNRFMGRFNNRLLDVPGTAVDAWLRELKVGPRTRNNLRNSVQALFNYGVARKYLPRDHDEIDAVPLAKDKGGEIEIFTPGEMAEILAVASAKHVPFLAISAFAGVRHAEIQRLDWAQLNRNAKIIEIKAGAAKTASRRVIPILPNLAAWLKPHWNDSGDVCSFTNMVLQFVELTRRVNEKQEGAEGRRQTSGSAAGRGKENDGETGAGHGRDGGGGDGGGRWMGAVRMETQRAAAFVYQLPGGGDTGCGQSFTGSRELAADDFPALPRTGAAGGGEGVVLHQTEKLPGEVAR